MSFEVASAAGLEKFNKFLLDNSYVSGWTPTQKDVDIFKAIKSSPDGEKELFRKKYDFSINFEDVKN